MKQEPSFLYTTDVYDDEGFLAALHPDKLPAQVGLVFVKHVLFKI